MDGNQTQVSTIPSGPASFVPALMYYLPFRLSTFSLHGVAMYVTVGHAWRCRLPVHHDVDRFCCRMIREMRVWIETDR